MSLNDLIVRFLGRLLGLEDMQAVADYQVTFAAAWAHHAPVWLFFGCAILAAVVALVYLRFQQGRHRGARIALIVMRSIVLGLLLLMLAEPILMMTITSRKRPLLWLVFDGTDSIAIADELPAADHAALADAVGLAANPETNSPGMQGRQPSPGRVDYLKAMVAKKEGNLLEKLGEKFRLQAFVFDSPQGVRSIELSQAGKPGIDGPHIAGQLSTDGKVTALGAAFTDLARRHATSNLGGVVVFSDFNQNAGTPAVEAAKQLGAEIYTVGVGATTAVDVAAEVSAEPYAHKEESTSITVVVRQQGIDGQSVHVRLSAEQLGTLGGSPGSKTSIGEKTVEMTGPTASVEFPYVPDRAGRFWLVAEVEPVPGEVVYENNRAQREIIVLDDFLRLLYVEYEPTWEWRFIKEVFHRDRLVGMKGFRTFLCSSDPRVRRESELFVPTMTPPRSEFFAHDLIFLGDLPAAAPASVLSPRFCEMAKEFVGELGGGLVVISGPRFGPQQLADTPLAELLPVTLDRSSKADDRQPFHLKLTPMAGEYKFMQLGTSSDPQQMQKAWDSLGNLPWYQPVLRKHPQATALAEHPTATCVDGKEKQPLIAIRPYGRGEVVFLGFNETWRLRRLHGEKYFRQFWGQMMERLALNHALGNEKRFVVRTDRRHCQVDEPITVTVEARNAEFEPLSEDDLAGQTLQGELLLPPREGQAPDTQSLRLTQVRKGLFEARVTVFAAGEHRVRVTDPITNKPVEWTFEVLSTPVERQRAVRNVALQQALAAETGGRSLELKEVQSLAEQVRAVPKTEMSTEVLSLTSTWLCFALVAGLLLGEWLVRKWVNLP